MTTKLSPVMTQYFSMREKYKDCILFFRLGDFYEMFYDDAELVSRELGLTLTGKNCGMDERAPMCGVPFQSYEGYVAKLLNNGHKVAICEQITEPTGSKIAERDVVRVITPGTIVETSLLDESVNAYVLSCYKRKDVIAYAYADISTGEFAVGKTSGEKSMLIFNDQLMRVEPKEIICNQEMMDDSKELFAVKNNSCAKFNQYYEWAFSYSNCEKSILDAYKLNTIKGYDFDDKDCVIAIGVLWQYILETQKRELKHMAMPKFIRDDQFMYIDTNTRRNLELEQTMREGSKYGTLLWVLDKTQSGGGARMLRRYINEPLQDIGEITKRQNYVQALKDNKLVRASLIAEYKNVRDIERIVGKLAFGNISPRDCLQILETLDHTPKIRDILAKSNDKYLIEFSSKIIDLEDLRTKIFNTLDKDAPAVMKDGNYIKSGFNAELDRYRNLAHNTREFILNYEAKEKEKTGIKNLKVGYNRVFGYYIEVNKQFSDQVPFGYIRKQTISNNERYITNELKQFEEEVLTSEEQALKLEAKLFDQFKKEIFVYCTPIQNLANALSQLDAMMSLAIVAEEYNYTRPKLNEDSIIQIKNGRHPVIERLQKANEFISNDTILDCNDNRTMILTGPNMAGKSTYMRQVALITFMAHIGSFVPATEANICIVDRIFTRIGASDDLAVGQSTFMVEMVEVSNILRFATNKSLIILDEVGRGTSTHDGLSIAWSVVEYLSSHLTAKTLFATHYHELMQLEGRFPGIKNYCISIKEINGELVFLRKIMRGSATRSYGIEVASLAGLPKGIILRAKEILADLEDNKFDTLNQTSNKPIIKGGEIIDILKNCDMDNMTPINAFDTLTRLVEKSKKL